MKHIAQPKKKLGISAILAILVVVVIQSTLTGCAAAGKKSSGVITSREATEIWHSYEILPNYNYYFYGQLIDPHDDETYPQSILNLCPDRLVFFSGQSQCTRGANGQQAALRELTGQF